MNSLTYASYSTNAMEIEYPPLFRVFWYIEVVMKLAGKAGRGGGFQGRSIQSFQMDLHNALFF